MSVSPAQKLFSDGIVVIPILSKHIIAKARTSIEKSILDGPEVVSGLDDRKDFHISQLVGGSFGAFGSPSSYHNKPVRLLRWQILKQLLSGGFCQEFASLTGQESIEVLADRYRVQQEGTKVGGEKYHRDEANNARTHDVILGGWINLSDTASQYFSCLKGTQLKKNKKRGFSGEKPTEEQLQYSKTYTVKPGHLILFYQNILHQVHASTISSDSSRLHFGMRFTNASEPLYELDHVFDNFEPFQLPSGQDARMWPKLWWTNWPAKLEALSQFYVPELREERSLKKDPTQKRTIIPEVLKPTPSMRSHFVPYSEDERAIYKPRKLKLKRKLEAAVSKSHEETKKTKTSN